jgi:hypothetical protein
VAGACVCAPMGVQTVRMRICGGGAGRAVVNVNVDVNVRWGVSGRRGSRDQGERWAMLRWNGTGPGRCHLRPFSSRGPRWGGRTHPHLERTSSTADEQGLQRAHGAVFYALGAFTRAVAALDEHVFCGSSTDSSVDSSLKEDRSAGWLVSVLGNGETPDELGSPIQLRCHSSDSSDWEDGKAASVLI